MNTSNHNLHTPVYIKAAPDMPLPTDKTYYLVTSDGLFLNRNHEFFTSSVPIDKWPSELAGHDPFLKLNYPALPRRLIEQVVGFFAIVGERFASEAAVLIAWDRDAERLQTIVPDQCGVVGTSWSGEPYPISVDYEVPSLPPHLSLIGDIHSHVDGPAYASATDKEDERYRAGLHIVVGRIHQEPPEFHCEVTVDGRRFKVRDLSAVMGGYHRRRKHEVPQTWLDKVSVKTWNSARRAFTYLEPRTDARASTERPVIDSQPTTKADAPLSEVKDVPYPNSTGLTTKETNVHDTCISTPSDPPAELAGQ